MSLRDGTTTLQLLEQINAIYVVLESNHTQSKGNCYHHRTQNTMFHNFEKRERCFTGKFNNLFSFEGKVAKSSF